MNSPQTIVCKPTPWFLLRALAMLLMFSVFAVMFYIDGSSGYRKKNLTFYLHKSFQTANAQFSEMNQDGTLTAAKWKEHAEKQSVEFPEDRSVLPVDLEIPKPWPAILHDFDRMKPLQWNLLWTEYSGEEGLAKTPPEEAYTAQKIREQWIVFYICVGLSVAAAFILIRTLRRSISADDQGVVTQEGKRVAYSDLKVLDLRKWDTKGLAFADYEGASGKGRIRIDGLTYGGFKKEQDQPAEQLMQKIRANFSGELIEYTAVADTEPAKLAAKTD